MRMDKAGAAVAGSKGIFSNVAGVGRHCQARAQAHRFNITISDRASCQLLRSAAVSEPNFGSSGVAFSPL